MGTRAVMAVLGGLVLAGPAMAQTIDQSKLYLADAAACAEAESKGAEGLTGFYNLLFNTGVQFSEEAFCTFYDVKGQSQRDELLADAVCEFGGSMFADTFLIRPLDETTITVQSSRDLLLEQAYASNEDGGSEAISYSFTRCNLSDLPRP